MIKKVDFDGISIYTGGIDQICSDIEDLMFTQKVVRIHLCNAYTLALSSEIPHLWKSLSNADFNLPDGLPLAKAISPLKNVQIRGMDLVKSTFGHSKISTKLHFFYGVSAEVVDDFCERLTYYFGLNIRFQVLAAPFADLENLNLEELQIALRLSKPDFIWIGLGTPKQDYLVDKIYEWVNHPCAIIPVGAVFDFLLGTNHEAPQILRKMGLEWLFRWWKEPRRLTKRYTRYNLIFLFQVLRFFFGKLHSAINLFKRR